MATNHLKKIQHINASPEFLSNPESMDMLNTMVGRAYNMRKLKLVLKYVWFDMIESGKKKEEYREIKGSVVSLLFDMKAIRREYPGLKHLSHSIAHMLRKNPKDSKIWKHFNLFYGVEFYRGYQSDRKKASYKIVSVKIGKAKPSWSNNWKGSCFVIRLGEQINY